MKPVCVNQVFSGKLKIPSEKFDLSTIFQDIKHPGLTRKVYTGRPHMCVLKCYKKWTYILFSSGKFRIMGKKVNLDFIMSFLKNYLPSEAYLLEGPTLQTETFTFSLGVNINLQTYKESLHYNNGSIMYEVELFPALIYNKWPSIHVNVFHSGNVTVLGRNSRDYINEIKNYLSNLFSKSSMFTY